MITEEELKTAPVFGRDTWPFIPSGTRPNHPNNLARQGGDTSNLQWQEVTMNILVERLKEFRQDLKLTSSWIFAAVIALAVNFIVASIYSVPQPLNLPVLTFGVSLFVVFVVMAIVFLPSDINVRVVWTPDSTGWLFDQALSQQTVSSLETNNPSATAIISTNPILFADIVTPFAHLICLANLRDSLNKKKRTFVRVSNTATFGGGGKNPFLLLTINTDRKLSLAISRNLREKVESEAFGLVNALGEAKVTAGVYAFDYDPGSWQARGHTFLNEFLTWNADKLELILLNQIIGRKAPS